MRAASRIDDVLSEACERGCIPGAVAAVADSRGELYHRAVGWADPERLSPLNDRAVFRLASMTKLITAVAVLHLVDEGRVGLDDPFTEHLPEFAAVQVLDGWDGDTPRLRPPTRAATVREILSHSSGLSYEVWNQEILRYQTATGTPAISTGRIGVLGTPLIAEPGTVVEYGTGFDWAGQLVERVAGQSLDEFCRTHIFEPLGMTRTTLRRLPGTSAWYVPVLNDLGAGEFAETAIDYPQDPDFVTGGGCFYSTAADYLTLQRALLAGGTLRDTRILSEASVREIMSPQSFADVTALRSALPWLSADVDLGPGWRWGLGAMVNAVAVAGGRTAGSAGWWGIFNTTFWIDRRAGIAANLFMQFVPFYSEGAVTVAGEFERAVYESFA